MLIQKVWATEPPPLPTTPCESTTISSSSESFPVPDNSTACKSSCATAEDGTTGGDPLHSTAGDASSLQGSHDASGAASNEKPLESVTTVTGPNVAAALSSLSEPLPLDKYSSIREVCGL